MFDKIKQINELRKKSQDMKKDLEAEVLEISHKGVLVRINGNMDIIKLESNGKTDEDVLDAINQAIKESQKVAAKKMRGQLGDMGLDIPGL